ncbi:hypothetical protein T4D_15789 [Trichinella pseudospiralis]|uniref:Uncharacterized protein n=1 Tax=Trichinella pseudospiralis TaxID=6337 RepID=A0A0V1FWB3_TRIPS|nr:hypothetical protein T4D_15789 [Trichinella pseudospiralis]
MFSFVETSRPACMKLLHIETISNASFEPVVNGSAFHCTIVAGNGKYAHRHWEYVEHASASIQQFCRKTCLLKPKATSSRSFIFYSSTSIAVTIATITNSWYAFLRMYLSIFIYTGESYSGHFALIMLDKCLQIVSLFLNLLLNLPSLNLYKAYEDDGTTFCEEPLNGSLWNLILTIVMAFFFVDKH